MLGQGNLERPVAPPPAIQTYPGQVTSGACRDSLAVCLHANAPLALDYCLSSSTLLGLQSDLWEGDAAEDLVLRAPEAEQS